MVQIFSQSERLDCSWNDVIQDESHKFFKCRKGHTALLAGEDIYRDKKNILDQFNFLGRDNCSFSLERKCHICDCLYNVSIENYLYTKRILSQGCGADFTLYHCSTCKKVNPILLSDFSRLEFLKLKISKVSEINVLSKMSLSILTQNIILNVFAVVPIWKAN